MLKRLFLFVSLALAVVGSTLAADLFVSTTGTDAGSCPSSAPCASIAFATTAAASGDRILVASGTYAVGATAGIANKALEIVAADAASRPILNLGVTFATINNNRVVLDGLVFRNFPAAAVSLSTSGSVSSQIVFRNSAFEDGTSTAVVIDWTSGAVSFDRCSFVRISSSDGAAIYQENSARITVTNSTFVNNTASNTGGAMRLNLASPSSSITIIDSTFSGNSAPIGGAIYGFADDTITAPLGELRVARSNFNGNRAAQTGGAATVDTTARTSFTDCTFAQNSGDMGGALYLPLASNLEPAFIQRCTFTQNTAAASGGAIFSSNPVDIRSSRFVSNSATAQSGAAVFAQADITVADSELTTNIALNHGGAIYLDSAAVPTIERNKFMRNEATAGNGGAIYSAALRLAVTGNVMQENKALVGGAVYNQIGSLTVSGSTVSGNTASGSGAGVFTSGVTTVMDSTFSSNVAPAGGALHCVSATSGPSALALTISGSTFDGNVAQTADGAAVNAGVCVTTVTNSKFLANRAAGNGAGLVTLTASAVRISTTEFSNNNATNGAGLYTENVQNIHLTGVTGGKNIASTSGGILFAAGNTSVVELRAVNPAGSSPADFAVAASAGANLMVNVLETTTPGAVEIASGTVQVTNSERVTFSGLHLMGDAKAIFNTNVNVSSSFKWGNGTISATSDKAGLISLTLNGRILANGQRVQAIGMMLRDSLSASSPRSMNGVHLLNYGMLHIGYIANPNGANSTYPASARKEVPCLQFNGGAYYVAYNSSNTTLGFNCMVNSELNSSRFNVSGGLHIDGVVILNNTALTLTNRSNAEVTFHIRNMQQDADDYDQIVIRHRNDSYLGGHVVVLPEGPFSPAAEFLATKTLIAAPIVYGNFTTQDINLNTTDSANATKKGPYGVIRHTLEAATVYIDEKLRPDPYSGTVVVIIVSVILAVIAVAVLALYARTIIKCFLKRGKKDEEDEEDGSDSSDEEKPLNKGNNEAAEREAAAMAAVDAEEQKKSKKNKNKDTKEVELREVEVDETPVRSSKKGKGKKKEVEPVPEPESSESDLPVQKEKKKSPSSQKKSSKKPAKEESSDVSSSDDESESAEPVPKKKSSKKKVAESSSESAESS